MIEWRCVPDYPGYTASDTGQIKGPRGKILTPDTVHGGYYRVTLCKNGSTRRFPVHRLVLLSFQGPSNLCVRHLDGNPKNNCVENLRYGTRHENEQDKRLVGTYQEGSGNPFAKLTEDQVVWARDLADRHLSARRANGYGRRHDKFAKLLALELGLSVGGVKQIINRRNWNHI